jgi:hypothetical protein
MAGDPPWRRAPCWTSSPAATRGGTALLVSGMVDEGEPRLNPGRQFLFAAVDTEVGIEHGRRTDGIHGEHDSVLGEEHPQPPPVPIFTVPAFVHPLCLSQFPTPSTGWNSLSPKMQS